MPTLISGHFGRWLTLIVTAVNVLKNDKPFVPRPRRRLHNNSLFLVGIVHVLPFFFFPPSPSYDPYLLRVERNRWHGPRFFNTNPLTAVLFPDPSPGSVDDSRLRLARRRFQRFWHRPLAVEIRDHECQPFSSIRERWRDSRSIVSKRLVSVKQSDGTYLNGTVSIRARERDRQTKAPERNTPRREYY